MTFRIYLSPPKTDNQEKELVIEALESGWVAPLGPQVEAFENELANYINIENALALSSGTAGLHLALLVSGVKPGDNVVVPTLTFAATAFAVRYVGANPIFIDSEAASYNLDPELLEKYLDSCAIVNNLPAAVIVVDVFGQTANYESIIKICSNYNIPVIEDAAEALGARNGQQFAGTFGKAGVFSFNGNKIITTSGGGMLVSNDASFIAKAKYLSTQARQLTPWYEHHDIGFNYRLSNILAAIGRAQLFKLNSVISKRRRVKTIYTEFFAKNGSAAILEDAKWGTGNNWLSVALFDSGSDARRFMNLLSSNGIESRPVWKPMHQQKVFKGYDSLLNGTADNFFIRGLCLPSSEVEHAHEVISLWESH